MSMEDWNKQCKRVFLKAAELLLEDIYLDEIITMRVMHQPSCEFERLDSNGVAFKSIITSKTRNIGRYLWKGGVLSEQEEYDEMLMMVKKIQFSITKEVVGDLYRNAGLSLDISQRDLENGINKAKDFVFESIGVEANWIVVPFTIIKEFDPTQNEGALSYNLRRKWKYGSLQIYEACWLVNEIIIGYKDFGNELVSGYAYIPYRMFNGHPDWWREDGTHGHNYMMTRYDKRLDNKNFYVKLKLP